jgi:hypothetical protein
VVPAAGAADLARGFSEPTFPYLAADDQAAAGDHLAGAGAAYVRVSVLWADSAPTVRPPDRASATDPAWPQYYFDRIDSAVRTAKARGVEPILVVNRAPTWAEAADRPSRAPVGSWRPSPSDLANYLAALATRYRGDFRPAGATEPLPRARYFQIMNEPNLYNELSPQYERRGGRLIPVAAALYRDLLNAGYDAVKAASPGSTVIAASLGPFGDYSRPGAFVRTPPVVFARQLLCISQGTRLRALRCPQRARFDVFAFNAYPRQPETGARNSGDLAMSDVSKLSAPLRAAVTAGNVFPRSTKPIWLTEFSWATATPDGIFVSESVQAQYLVRSLYLLWRQGVRAALWWRLRDGINQPNGFQVASGLYTSANQVANDKPKVAVTAMRFPFLVDRRRRRAWGIAPADGTVVVERRSGSSWSTVASVPGRRAGVFTAKVTADRNEELRATLGIATSLTWRVR